MWLPADVTVAVTPADIARGVPGSELACPLTRALWGRFMGAREIAVTTRHARINGVLYDLPSEAREFVWAFDVGETVEPFTFTMRRAR